MLNGEGVTDINERFSLASWQIRVDDQAVFFII